MSLGQKPASGSLALISLQQSIFFDKHIIFQHKSVGVFFQCESILAIILEQCYIWGWYRPLLVLFVDSSYDAPIFLANPFSSFYDYFQLLNT
jgi:hypothetical protein